ncbi:MAG TPA: DUF4265 domain-containing protein [Candidatus Acidoferrum sp.]|nr:DUF4265 domain-containing protein [Candidatus Acidoferrum sp.]
MDAEKERIVVEVRFAIEKDSEGYPRSRDAEALLCEPLNPDCSRCRVGSVPFYLNNVAYGDTVTTKPNDSGDALEFDKIVRHNGHSVYRLRLNDKTDKDETISHLLGLGVLLEQNGRLLAIAVPPDANLDRVVDFILDGKARGLWGAQDGYIFEE